MPRVRFALAAAVALVLVAARAAPAPPAPSLDGGWTGTAILGGHHHTMDATATLGQTGRSVVGTIALAERDGTLAFMVTGVVRGRRARLAGVIGAQSLVWRGRWRRRRHVWRGRLRMRTAKHTKRGRLTLGREIGGPAPECGGDLFAQELMPRVFEPICAQCHVAGGLAQSTRLRVTVGDPVATSRSAVALVDVADPPRSLLLRKPRGELSHGGSQRVVPGSAEDDLLQQWVELVTTPGCDGGNGGGGGGGGGGTGDLYTDNCASCHGADARGLGGRPDIHCSRSIHDVVRNGRKGSVEDMPAFPNLTDADIATIQAFLRGLCPTTGVTGAELYAGNCASCHGAAATGTTDAPSVRCATRVTNAVRVGRGDAMPSFPVLTDTEVALIDGHLGALCAEAGRTGADLYASNCSTCHGATARGGHNALGVHGPSIRCTGANDYREKVREGEDGMPAFPALDTTDVNAIVDFVHGAYCTGG